MRSKRIQLKIIDQEKWKNKRKWMRFNLKLRYVFSFMIHKNDTSLSNIRFKLDNYTNEMIGEMTKKQLRDDISRVYNTPSPHLQLVTLHMIQLQPYLILCQSYLSRYFYHPEQ